MGNQQCKFSQKFNKKYDFIQYHKDQVLGHIKIYRKKQPFYDYLMIVDRSVNDDQIQKTIKQLYTIQDSFKSQQGSMFLRVYGHQIVKESIKNCNNKRSKIRMYLQFYNYTLRNLIQHRNQQGIKFSSEQIMYVLDNIMKIYHFYQSIQALDISFQSNGIYLTPEGELRFSPLKIFGDTHSQEIQCVDIDCRPVKYKKTFKIKDKLIVFEIKKIVVEMTQLCDPVLVQDKNVFILKQQLNNCVSIKEVKKYIKPALIDKIEFCPKKISAQSQQQTTKIYKTSPLVSTSEFSHSSKISVKNMIQDIRKQAGKFNKRPQTQYRVYYP